MQIKTICYLIILYALFGCSAASETQNSSSLNIYVDSNSPSLTPNGTESDPYLYITDAFNIILNSSSPISDATIYLALFDGVYELNKTAYTFDGKLISSLTITKWISPRSNVSAGTDSDTMLMLTEASLTFNHLKL